MRFKIDENLPQEIADVLRKGGHDALTVYDQDIVGINDDSLLKRCISEARVLVSLDTGFSNIGAYPPGEFRGIVVIRVCNQGKRHILNVFGRVMPLFASQPVDKHLWIVEENMVRIRGETA